MILVNISYTAAGAVVYVGGIGPGNYSTIQEGVTAAKNGDTVYVYSGMYSENVIINKRITLLGENANTTIIDGGGTGDTVSVTNNDVTITHFTIRNSGSALFDAGVGFDFVSNCNLISNIISLNNYAGVHIFNSDNIKVGGNVLLGNGPLGVYVEESSFNTIWNNNASNNAMTGINLFYSHNNHVYNNDMYDNLYGIYLSYSGNNTIENNTGSNFYYNIRLYESNFNLVLNNVVSGSDVFGMFMGHSFQNTLSGNSMSQCGLQIEGDQLYHWNQHTIDTSNTVNGKPIYYLKDQVGGVVPQDAGGVILANCRDITVQLQDLTQSSTGMELGFSSQNQIIAVSVSENIQYGIYSYRSDNNNYTDVISFSSKNGLYFVESNGNTLKNSNASYSTRYGFTFLNSQGNNVTDNSFYYNEWFNIYFGTSTNNLIYRNNFVNNSATGQAYDDSNNGNSWDYGYPTGGNYWSDYEGVDLNSTPTQDVPPPDGIGDTQYDIDANSFDNYPLMKPYKEDLNPPIILLNSPSNNSVISEGTMIDLEILDDNPLTANYSINGGGETPFSDPFDISTSGWLEGGYTITVNAVDSKGNSISSWFFVSIDNTPPEIILNSPANNSLIPKGTNLDFLVSDSNLDNAQFSLDGGSFFLLSDPYDISTSGWSNGIHNVRIEAIDIAGNSNSGIFYFTIDSIPPQIALNSPLNNSIISKGTLLDFLIIEDNLDSVAYSLNGQPTDPISDPYDISTSTWTDGDYTVLIEALDLVGNTNSSWYFFTLDSTVPDILLITPGNNTIIQAGTEIDLDILDTHFDSASYSVNGGGSSPLSSPFNIQTNGWADGVYTILVEAQDLAGNVNSRWYQFTMDSTRPQIILNTPLNNSIIQKDTTLDFDVIDLHLDQITHNVNNQGANPIMGPYDISTSTWSDGDYTIRFDASDIAGNTNSSWFYFTLDSVKPVISLVSPSNNSFIDAGDAIDLSVTETNLKEVQISVAGGAWEDIVYPFDIETSSWNDGTHSIEVRAEDLAGNVGFAQYSFQLDSTLPSISLESPSDGSYLDVDTIINLEVTDDNLDSVLYSENGASTLLLDFPYDIDTSSWNQGDYEITVTAVDLAGNQRQMTYSFVKDTEAPQISLTSPSNNSLISVGTDLEFAVSDDNLDSVEYSLDGSSYDDLPDPYSLDTSSWNDGTYTIYIRAEDEAGNTNEKWFTFLVDESEPSIISTYPDDNADDISVGTDVVIEFSEPMDTESVEDAISISPFSDHTLSWNNDDTEMTISFSEPLDAGSNYKVSISTKAEDMAGRGLDSAFDLEFTTEGAADVGDDGPSSDWMPILLILIIVIVVVLILFFVLAKRKKPVEQVVEPEVVENAQVAASTYQVQCPFCSNQVSVMDTGLTQNVTCPFCSNVMSVGPKG
jgi:parallel beta-helix repeat protein